MDHVSALKGRSGPAVSRRALLSGALGAGSLAVLTACGTQGAATPQVELGDPVKGGDLRVGFVGGGASDTLDGQVATNLGDIARAVNLYDTLLWLDDNYELQPRLATEVVPNEDATVWTITLREGVKFNDGRPLRVQDVIASINRIKDPDDPKNGAVVLSNVVDMRQEGDNVLVLTLDEPNAALDETLGTYTSTIVPEDYDPTAPVGTGPFMLESFTAAQSTVMVRNPHYWGDEGPWLDRVVLLNFNDTDALINAVLSNQVDAITQIPAALKEVLESDSRLEILESETGMFLPFTMRVDVEPFDDVRVRQAFRLAVDREGMIEQVLSGEGVVANDMFARYDPGTPDLPQRTQDLEEAKRLLAEAGYPDGLDVELTTAPIQAGVVEAAQVFAEQAAGAGIRVKVNRMDLTAFWGDYLNYPFSQSFWNTRNFIGQAMSSSLPESPFNETHYDNPEFADLVDRAAAAADEEERNSLIGQAQEILYNDGGNIIWAFADQFDAYHSYVGGLRPNRTGIPLSGFELQRVWIGEVS